MIHDVYASAEDPERWPSFLEKLADEIGSGLACHYGRGRARPSRRQVELVEMLVPHIAQALRLHERWRTERLAGTAASQATERSATGFVVVDGRGRVVRCNRVASDIVARGDGLCVRDGRVGCVHPGDDARLRAAMAAAATTALGSGTAAGGILGVRRSPLGPPYPITIAPVSGDGVLFARHGGAAVLLIDDPARHRRPDAAALQETYGWTPAETRIALSIADGLKPADIARRDGKSVGTVRGQLKIVFHKTGVASQSELVRVILSSAVPRSGNGDGSA